MQKLYPYHHKANFDGSVHDYSKSIKNSRSDISKQQNDYFMRYPMELLCQYELDTNINNETCPRRNCSPCMRSINGLMNPTHCKPNPCFYMDNPIMQELPKPCDLRVEINPCTRMEPCLSATKSECCRFMTRLNTFPQKFRSETFNYEGICRDYRQNCCKQRILAPSICSKKKSDRNSIQVGSPTKPCNEYTATYIYQPTTPAQKESECDSALVGRYEEFIPFEKPECKSTIPAPANTCYVKTRRCSDFIPTIRQSMFRQERKRVYRTYRGKSNRLKGRNKMTKRQFENTGHSSPKVTQSLSPDIGNYPNILNHEHKAAESAGSTDAVQTMNGITPLGGMNPLSTLPPDISPVNHRPPHPTSENPQLYVQLASCMSFEPTLNNHPINTAKSSPQTITANSVFSIPLSEIEKNLGDCVLGLTHNILVSPGEEMLPNDEPKMNVHVEKHSTTSVRAESILNSMGQEIPVGAIPVHTFKERSLTDSYNLNSHNQIIQMEFQMIRSNYDNLFRTIDPIRIEVNQNNYFEFVLQPDDPNLNWDRQNMELDIQPTELEDLAYQNEWIDIPKEEVPMMAIDDSKNCMYPNYANFTKSNRSTEYEHRELNFQISHSLLMKKNKQLYQRIKLIQLNQNASTTHPDSIDLSKQSANIGNFDKQAIFVRGETYDTMKNMQTMMDLASHNMEHTTAYDPFYCVIPQNLKVKETENQGKLSPKHKHYKPALHGTAKHPLITSNKVTPEAQEILLSIKDTINMIMDDLKTLNVEITSRNFRSCSAIAEHLKTLPDMLTLLFDHLHYSPNEYGLLHMTKLLNNLINKIVSDPVSIIFHLIEFGYRLNEISRQLGENLLPEELPKLIHAIQSKLQKLKIGYVTRQYYHIPQSSDDLVAPYNKSRTLTRLEKDCGCQVNLLHPEDPRAVYCPSGYRTIEVIYDPDKGRHDLFRRRLNQTIHPNRQVARLVTTIVHQINDQEFSMKIEDVDELLNSKIRPRYCDVKSVIFASPRYNQISR